MQQQPPPTRNLLLFVMLTLLLFSGWMWYKSRQQPPRQDDGKVAKKDDTKKDDPKDKKPADLDPPPEPGVTAPEALIALGSPDRDSPFHLHVQLDPRGAGVRSVLLNKFQQADDRGLPVEGMRLHLVPDESNRLPAAFALYLYDPADPRNTHPLETLALALWEVVPHQGKPIRVDDVEGKRRQTVSFRAEAHGVRVIKTFSLTEGEYHLGLEVTLERPERLAGGAKGSRLFYYQLRGASGLPIEGKWYTSVFRNALFGVEDNSGHVTRELQELAKIGIWQGGKPEVPSEDKFIRYAGVAVQYFASVIVVDTRQREGVNQRFLRRATPTLERAVFRGKILSGSLTPADTTITLTSPDGKVKETIYLPPHLRKDLGTLLPGTAVAVIFRPRVYHPGLGATIKEAVAIRTGVEADATHAVWEDDITVRVSTEPVELPVGGSLTHRYLLYHGPVKPSLLGLPDRNRANEVDTALVNRYRDELGLQTMTDSPSPGWMGNFANKIWWTWLVIKATNFMHWLLGWLAYVLPSYGLCIIVLTVLVRGAMFPLSRKQALMSLRMQELAPELKKLKEKHKDDQQEFARAQMALFRQHGVNPFGSCWVLLLQMPIFMGLYFALRESVYFRLAPFWPSWIENLAAPDMMFEMRFPQWFPFIGGELLPLLSRPQDYGGFLYLGPYFNLLPILAVALMIMQQKMMTPPPTDEQQEVQQKMMKWMMIIFGIFFYKEAAGLCVYFIASSLWGFAERKLLPKSKLKLEVNTDKLVAAAVGAATGGEQVTAAPAAAGGVTRDSGRKATRTKKKGERKPGKEEPATGLGRLRQRLSDWWNDVLDKAKKK